MAKINYSLANEIIYLNYSLYENHNISFTDEIKKKELLLLQRKRESEYFNENTTNFSISDKNQILKIIEQQRKLGNARNDLLKYPINYERNICENLLNESLSNSNENSKIKFVTDDIKNNSISKSSVKKDSLSKIKYFKVSKNISKNYSLDTNTNNEILTLKNNKKVYINKYLLNSYSTSRAIKKLHKVNFVIRKKRSSKYRGVSKNGSKFQVLIMINNNKYYIGSYPSEELAARIYDIYALKYRGFKARTNFFYDSNQIKAIRDIKINAKSDDISDIIMQLKKYCQL